MKSIGYALLSLVLFAGENVVLQVKLSKYNATHVLVCFYLAMLPLALISTQLMKLLPEKASPLPSSVYLLATIVGVVYFVADFCYVSAYTSGGSVMTVTTLVILFPVLASLMLYLYRRELPNGWQIAGYCVAFVAILLVTKGNLLAAERLAP